MSQEKVKLFRNIFCNIAIIFILIIVTVVGIVNYDTTIVSQNGIKAIYRGNEYKNNISLMINVYWGTEYIDKMLEIFKENEVKVTFFVGGMWASENEKYLLKFIEQGHEIGNHGYYHKDHDKISKERNEEEIFITHKLVKALTGVDMNLFAPPSGAYNEVTLEVANELGYKTIMWSKDTIDWRDKNSELILNRAIAKPQNGDLILMHPTLSTIDALSGIINFYKNNKYNLVTVSQNIGL